jgi:cystathionine beta-lyase family protein involved in aluminum resistance
VFGHKRHVSGSLCDLGVEYIEDFIDPNLLYQPETEAKLKRLMAPPTSLVHIQKSRGYAAERRTLSNRETELLCSAAKKINPNVIVFVDNCYGEFVETSEPPHHGADLIAGSLIKNPGGGLAVCGGYVAGKRAYVVRTLERLTAPGIGGHLGCLYNQGRLLFHGLFIAPSVVASAVKGAVFLASVLEELGYRVLPAAKEIRFDIIQAVELKNREALIAFQRAIQAASPVNSHVAPIPAIMPGYDDEVIMAGGSFIQGSTIELSSDGPLRAPYMAYFQGSLTYGHVRYVVRSVAASLLSL